MTTPEIAAILIPTSLDEEIEAGTKLKFTGRNEALRSP